jgi:hypothetical protein
MAVPDEPNWFELLAKDDLAATFREWCETVGELQQLIVRRSQADLKNEINDDKPLSVDPDRSVDLKRLLALSKELEKKLFI